MRAQMGGEEEGAELRLLNRRWLIGLSIGAGQRWRRLSPETGGQCYHVCQRCKVHDHVPEMVRTAYRTVNGNSPLTRTCSQSLKSAGCTMRQFVRASASLGEDCTVKLYWGFEKPRWNNEKARTT